MPAGQHGHPRDGYHQLPGHPRVYQQAAGVLQEQDEDLAPAGNPVDPVTREFVVDHRSWRGEDPAVQDIDRDDGAAGDGRAQVPAERLDLG